MALKHAGGGVGGHAGILCLVDVYGCLWYIMIYLRYGRYILTNTILNGRSSGSNTWRYVNVPYVKGHILLGCFPLNGPNK